MAVPKSPTDAEVLRAAADLVDEVGFDRLTRSALAHRLGVAEPSLHRHTRTMASLRARVVVYTVREMGEHIRTAVAARSGREGLAAYMHAYRDFALRHPERFAATRSRSVRPVRAAAHHILRGYGLTGPDHVDALRLLRSTIHGYSGLETSGGFWDRRESEASWERVIDALHTLLEHWPAARAPEQGP